MTDLKNILLLVIFCIMLFATAVQLFYYLFFYLQVILKKSGVAGKTDMPVSVIICARNESENLQSFLPSVLKQDYPDFEVIVVNDCSEDNSYEILGNFLKEYPQLKISTITRDPKFTHNKKFAQFIGIKAAKNEILLFTDADCKPVSEKWIETMVSHFDDKTDFVLGYGGYFKQPGLLNKYIRSECMTIAMQYLGMAIRGIPYMGVGRNLAYRKSVFFHNKGFGSHNHVVSGDDDLLVNSVATGKNTSVEYRTPANTLSVPSASLNEWVIQKKRHFTTAPYYKFRDKFLLITEPLSRILFYVTLIILLSFTFFWPWVLAVFMVRLIIQIITFSRIQKTFDESGMVGFLLLFDLFSPVINSIIYLGNTRSRSVKSAWK